MIIVLFWAKLDDLEGIGHGKSLLYTTHVLVVVNICTKYEKDPSSERKVTAWFIVSSFLVMSHEQIAKSEADNFEGKDLYQKLLLMTPLVLVVNIVFH